jgi:hypothetical protein
MNQIYKIFPYKTEDGGWSFDDKNVNLLAEPFVLGMPEIINELINDVNVDKISMLFSLDEFPDITTTFSMTKEDMGGAWYRCEKTRRMGWLCPAVKKYFNTPPKKIYIKIDVMKD